MDIGTFTAAAAGLKTAVDITKSILKLKISTEIQSKVAELQGVIISAQTNTLEAQSNQLALLDKKRDLESQITKFKTWNTEKKRYKLENLYRGSLAYALKKEEQGGEVLHYICADCYEYRKKTILQGYDDTMGHYMLKCNVCKTEIIGIKPENQPR